jgi:dihydrofolate synthase/folylpolyglutamate synthase
VTEELAEVYRAILARSPEHSFEPTLERVRAVLDLLGSPQNTFKAVHITGTNGKTTTARMIESLIGEYGLRTGRFTSPHLTSITERISVDGQPLTDERFVEVYHDVLPYIQMVDQESVAVGGPMLSFFEVLVVMAYAAFADAPVDVAVIEVGMGGTWDATNVIDAEVAVITPIHFDHQMWLGNTLDAITQEKAGIIKPGAAVVSAVQPEEAAEILYTAAAAAGARLIREGVDVAVLDRQVGVGGQLVTLRGTGGIYTDVFIPLHGEHQTHNALLALAAVEALMTGGGALPAGIVEAGFDAVTSPGRLELVRSSPTVLVDAAHNPHGMAAAVTGVREAFAFRRLIAVVAVLADKDAEGILAELEPAVDEVVITRSASSRALRVDELAGVAEDVFGTDRVHTAELLPDAIDLAVTLAERDDLPAGLAGVLVTGSITVVAETRILFRCG